MLRHSRVGNFKFEHCQRELVNDAHSKLNATVVKRIECPRNVLQLQAVLKRARQNAESVSVSGGRHAMGGQQFLQNGVLLDLSSMNRVISFDRVNGLIEVESGMMWPALVAFLQESQADIRDPWTIIQKQTGCNQLSIGGALAANVHGRGLRMAPFVADVEEFKIVTADGALLKCSRDCNRELFALAIGGYGLFGIISSATLRLMKRQVLQRTVELVDVADAVQKMEAAASAGSSYGDFQFAIDDSSPDFLRKGILSTYKNVSVSIKPEAEKRLLSDDQWQELLLLAHTNKSLAFEKYSRHYLSTNGQLYLSDSFQLATYKEDYHVEIDKRTSSCCVGTEMISELYVPRDMLASFLTRAAMLLREQNANVIYGTVRLIERDDETFLPWAKERWACTVLNLHVEHSPQGLANASRIFRDLIELAANYGGSFYLTYHRFATVQQLFACYPQIAEFIEQKRNYDPLELFSSNWYEHLKKLIC